MIDYENDKAVIIDLGIATTKKGAQPLDNRRYGGVNDLVSLGQIIYKMYTGEHLFAESESMETTIYAQELNDHRDWIYTIQVRVGSFQSYNCHFLNYLLTSH